jgi:hypothetical protein
VQVVANITPHCHDITRLLSQSMEQRLSLRTRLLIPLHFLICVWCKRYGEQLRFLRKYSSGFPQNGCERGRESLSAGARERLKRVLEERDT